MAEEVQVSMPPGGNGMNLKVGNKALGITGPIVIPVVCLGFVAAIGWLRSQDLRDGLASINVHLQQLYTRQDAQRSEVYDLVKDLMVSIRENRDIMGKKLDEQDKLLRDQTEEVRKQHAVLIYNQRHEPNQHLTLDIPIPKEQK